MSIETVLLDFHVTPCLDDRVYVRYVIRYNIIGGNRGRKVGPEGCCCSLFFFHSLRANFDFLVVANTANLYFFCTGNIIASEM